MAQGTGGRRRRIGIAAAIVLVVLVGGALTLRAILTPERLRAEVVRATSQATGLGVELGAARLSFVPFGVSIEKLVVAGETPEQEPLLTLESAMVRLQLAPLLGRRVVVDRVEVNHPVITLQREGEAVVLPGKLGETPAAPADGAEPASSGGFTGVVEALSITDAAVRIRTPGGTEDVEVSGIGLTARLDATDPSVLHATGQMQLAGLSLAALEMYRETLDRLHPVADFDLAYRPQDGVLELNPVRLQAAPLDLSFTGRVSGLPDAPVIDVALAPQSMTLEELLPLVPPAAFPEGRVPKASGPVTVSATIQGPLGHPETPPDVRAEIRFDGADLGMEGFAVGVRDVRGTVIAHATSLEMNGLTAQLGNGSLDIQGRVDGTDAPETATYDLAVKGDVDLGIVEQAGFAPEGVKLGGRVKLDTRVKGSADQPEAAQLTGEVVLSDARYSAPELAQPVTGLGGRAVLQGSDVLLQDVKADVGHSRFTGSGRVTNALSPSPAVTFNGHSQRLDLVEWMPEAAAAAAAGGGAAPPTRAQDDPLLPPIPELTADIRMDVDSLLTVGAALSGVTLTAKLREGKARVDAKVADGTFGEGIRMSGLTAGVDVEGQTMVGGFSAPRVEAHKVPLTEMKGNLRLGADKKLSVSDVTAALFTGRVEGKADVDLSDPAAPAFDIESRALNLQANDLVSILTPADNFLFGQLDLSSSFSGKGVTPSEIAASLIGNGSMKAREGRINKGPQTNALWNALNLNEQESIPFRNLATAFSVDQGKLRTDDLVVQGGDAEWKANGFVGFDGIMDYTIQVNLNEALSKQFRQRVGRDVAALLEGSSGNVVLDLRLSGDVKRPSVTLDRNKLAERASKNAADAVKKEIEKGKDALGGKLKGLLGG